MTDQRTLQLDPLAAPRAVIGADFPKVAIPLLDSARESVRVIVFDWRYYRAVPSHPVSMFNLAFARAAKRGVSVRALVNSDAIIGFLKSMDCDARRLHSTKLLHSKMLLVDDTKLLMGSHNYTQHAFCMNEEMSVLLDLSHRENSFTKYFDRLWGL